MMKIIFFKLLVAYLAAQVRGDLGQNGDPGIYDEDNKPVLELPYGKFEPYSKRDGLWTFKNIPYAAPPLGPLRWKKPQPPNNFTGVQKADRTDTLPYQVWMDKLDVVDHDINIIEYDGDFNDYSMLGFGKAIGASEEFEVSSRYSEDCLNLDIVVPESALVDPSLKLPVAIFIHGGAFIAGGKEHRQPLVPLYDGYGLVDGSHGEIIYVVFNYRLGAFGFLGGSTMEREAVPNVGLWDQRAVFQWVQDYIHLVGGNPEEVTAMGHSAGGSSIMFHLTAAGGTLDPLFKYAVLLSPAYVPMWDRKGEIEDRFQKFASLAGCEGLGVECLQTRTAGQLQNANQETSLRESSSTYSFGPVPDGTYIRQLPMLEWAAGNIWPIEKIILTHVSQETALAITTNTTKQGWSFNYLASLLPQQHVEDGWLDKILKEYPFWHPTEEKWLHEGERYQSELVRMQNIVLHSCFTCHMRWLVEALGEQRVYLGYYTVVPFVHGADLAVLFWNEDFRASTFLHLLGSALRSFVDILGGHDLFIKFYRQYFTSFIQNKGNPNVGVGERWRHPVLGASEGDETSTVGDVLAVALKMGNTWAAPFKQARINTMPKSKCDFWLDFYSHMSDSGNYTVPS